MTPSLRNWGVAVTSYDLETDTLTLESVDVIKTKPLTKSKLSKAEQDLQAAKTLLDGVLSYVKTAELVVIELPIGSQSAAAMKSYGICIGITACLTHLGIPFIYKSPYDLKKVIGKIDTTKEEIIRFVGDRHPNKLSKFKNSAEHQADAVLAIYAALPEIKETNNENHINTQ